MYPEEKEPCWAWAVRVYQAWGCGVGCYRLVCHLFTPRPGVCPMLPRLEPESVHICFVASVVYLLAVVNLSFLSEVRMTLLHSWQLIGRSIHYVQGAEKSGPYFLSDQTKKDQKGLSCMERHRQRCR